MTGRPPTIVTRTIRLQDVQVGHVVQYVRRDGSPQNEWFTVAEVIAVANIGVHLFTEFGSKVVHANGDPDLMGLHAQAARSGSPLSLVTIQEEVPA